jgi:hypothetical protein
VQFDQKIEIAVHKRRERKPARREDGWHSSTKFCSLR